MKKVIFFIDEEDYIELKKIAEAERMSFSAVVREFVKEQLRQRDTEESADRIRQMTREVKNEVRTQAERIAKLAVKAALYSIATRAQLNSLMYDIAEDKEEAERKVQGAWKFAIEQLKKDEW